MEFTEFHLLTAPFSYTTIVEFFNGEQALKLLHLAVYVLCFLLADEQKRSGDGEVAPSGRQAAETLCPLALAFYV